MEFLSIESLPLRKKAAVIAMQPLIKSYAWKASQRAHVLNMPLDMDDFVQELNMACCRCVERYDPETGWTFEAFLRGAFFNEIQGLFRKHAKNLKYGHFVVSETRYSDDEDGSSLFDQVEDTGGQPDEVYEGEMLHRFLCANLSPTALSLYNLVTNPPPEIFDQIERYNAAVLESRTDEKILIRMTVLGEPNPTDWAVLLGLPKSFVSNLFGQIKKAVNAYRG